MYGALPLSAYLTIAPTEKEDLKKKLLESIEVIESEGFDFQGHWAETLQGEDRINPSGNKAQVLINDAKFRQAGAGPGYRDKMPLAESLHNLKTIDPERYNRMEKSALSDPDYRRWAEESYEMAKNDPEHPETRSFEEWHRKSRFDQVIGGYLFAGDKDIPTMRGWQRDRLPWGKALRAELETLANDLSMQ